MTTRVLPMAEWPRLAGSDLGEALPGFPGAQVIVCEDADGALLGHLALVPLWHVEGVYVEPSVRGTGVLQALVQGMVTHADAMGVSTVFPGATDDRLAAFVQRIGGVEIPIRWFALAVRES